MFAYVFPSERDGQYKNATALYYLSNNPTVSEVSEIEGTCHTVLDLPDDLALATRTAY